jgi:hypothetical protein
MRSFVLFFLAITSVNGFTASNRQWTSRTVKSTSAMSMSAGGVVITGGANGVGFAYAGEFMDRGYDVVICDIQDSERLPPDPWQHATPMARSITQNVMFPTVQAFKNWGIRQGKTRNHQILD